MASRGRGHRGRPRGTGKAPLTIDHPRAFDQRAFVEAVGVAEATIAQARIAGSQGDPSNPVRPKPVKGQAGPWLHFRPCPARRAGPNHGLLGPPRSPPRGPPRSPPRGPPRCPFRSPPKSPFIGSPRGPSKSPLKSPPKSPTPPCRFFI